MEHSETKEKILRILQTRGPSLPVHISTQINSSILFTSAFLSELLSEKKIKMSNMRVGSSPVYFIPGQELQLEKYSGNIKGKEKEALFLLSEKKFLEDSKQEPAIRVALRSIKDFAIPFQKNNNLFWRYLTIPENEFKSKEESEEKEKQKESKEIIESSSEQSKKEIPKQEIEIFDNKPKEILKATKQKITKKKIIKKSSEKKNDKFFNKIKDFLSEKQIEISGIEGFSKNDLTLKIKKGNEEKILVAYNKKRLTEADIVNAHKKAKEQNLRYIIYCFGEPLKKLTSFIDAIKELDKIEKIE